MKRKRSIISISLVTLVVFSLCAVCASTSVSAAPSGGPSASSANVQSGLVGAQLQAGTGPAVCSQDANSIDLFVTGTNGALYWSHWSGVTWSSWTNLGGYLTSSPAAVSYADGVIDVFVRGGDGALWSRATSNGGTSWHNWYKIGGRLLPDTGPAAYTYPGRMGVFVTGMNHALWHFNMDGSGWGVSPGGYLTSSPSATSWVGDGIFVAARGRDGALWVTDTTNGGTSWNSWDSYGGRILEGTGPAVVFTSPYIRLFVVGTGHALYLWWGASGWTSLGGYLISSPTACSHTSLTIDAFAVGGDGDIWSRLTTNAGISWNPWYELPV